MFHAPLTQQQISQARALSYAPFVQPVGRAWEIQGCK